MKTRMFIIDVSQSGHVSIRGPGERRPDGYLPVFSTDTREEAEALIVRHCRLARDGSRLYRLNDFSGDHDDLDAVTELFRSTDKRKRGRP